MSFVDDTTSECLTIEGFAISVSCILILITLMFVALLNKNIIPMEIATSKKTLNINIRDRFEIIIT